MSLVSHETPGVSASEASGTGTGARRDVSERPAESETALEAAASGATAAGGDAAGTAAADTAGTAAAGAAPLVKRAVLTATLLGYAITAINSSILTTGIAYIARDLALDQAALSWVQVSYTLAYGALILLGGKLGDLAGRKRAFMLALALFGVGSGCAGAAWGAASAIFARVLQGVGAAILAPTSLALLSDTFHGAERVRAVSWYGAVPGLGMSVGLVLGGVLASFFTWRAGFLINVPLCLILLVVAGRRLPDIAPTASSFDAPGVALSAGASISLVYAINGAAHPAPWAATAVALFALFLVRERRAAEPVMPFSLFSLRARALGYLGRMLYMCAVGGFWFFLSEYLQMILGYAPLACGVAFFPMTLMILVSALLVPRCTAAFGDRATLLMGCGILVVGFALMLTLTETTAYLPVIAGALLLMGFGQGLATSPLTNISMTQVSPRDMGVSSSVLNAGHTLGSSLGLSVMVAAGAGEATLLGQFHVAMAVSLGFVLATVAVALLLPRRLAE